MSKVKHKEANNLTYVIMKKLLKNPNSNMSISFCIVNFTFKNGGNEGVINNPFVVQTQNKQQIESNRVNDCMIQEKNLPSKCQPTLSLERGAV